MASAGYARHAAASLLAAGLFLAGVRHCAGDGTDVSNTSDPGLAALDAAVRVLPFKEVKYFDLPNERITRVTLLADHLYVETKSNRIYAIDRVAGFVRWVFDLDTKAPLEFPPCIAYGIPEERAQIEEDLAKYKTKLDEELKAKNRDVNKVRELRTRKQEMTEKHKVAVEHDLFFALSKGWLFCIHRTGGQFLWKREITRLPLPIIASAQPVATRAHVFIANVRLDRVYPIEIGKQDASIHMSAGDQIVGPPVYEDPSIYFTSRDGSAYCYNVNGQLSWRYKTESAVVAGPAIGRRIDKRQGREQLEKTCYVGGTDFALYAVDADTGGLRWKYETGAEIRTPATPVGETVYVKTEKGALLALNVKPVHRNEKGESIGEKRNGDLRWQIPLAERFVVKTKNRVYVLGANQRLIGVDEMSGTIKSEHDLSAFPYVLTNTQDGTLYLIHPAGHFYACQESKTEF